MIDLNKIKTAVNLHMKAIEHKFKDTINGYIIDLRHLILKEINIKIPNLRDKWDEISFLERFCVLNGLEDKLGEVYKKYEKDFGEMIIKI